jgi:hypothetical protein
MGVVGDTVGIVTESLVRYALTATVEDPKVAVKPLHLRGGKKDEPDTSPR